MKGQVSHGLAAAASVLLIGAFLAGCSSKTPQKQSGTQSSHSPQSSPSVAMSRQDDGKQNTRQSSPVPPSTMPEKTNPSKNISSAESEHSRPTAQECVTSQLTFTVVDIPHVAGDNNYGLSAVNKGINPCFIGGWPGVSFLDSAGKAIGEPAVRIGNDTPRPSLVLQSGQSAVALLQLPVTAGKDGDKDTANVCAEVDAAKIRVIPPDQTEQILIPAQTVLYAPLRVCSHLYRAEIYPFVDPSQLL